MPCYKPLQASQVGSGRLFFGRSSAPLGARFLEVPCGQCMGCRLDYSREWAVRCMCESQMHLTSVSVTLTYDDKHLPEFSWLKHRDFQLFMKRLRERLPAKRFSPLDLCDRPALRRPAARPKRASYRYFMCGEYGSKYSRPHYHAIIFGLYPTDQRFSHNSESGFPLYRSEWLNSVWQKGNVLIGDVTFESAAYIARYFTKVSYERGVVIQEIFDPDTGEIFSRPAEYCEPSRSPGLGATWFAKFSRECFAVDGVRIRGVTHSMPRFYDTLLARSDDSELLDLFKELRRKRMDERMNVLTEEFPELRYKDVRRLDVEERVKLAAIRSLHRR